MANVGVFDPRLRAEAWFDPTLLALGWFDPELIEAAAAEAAALAEDGIAFQRIATTRVLSAVGG